MGEYCFLNSIRTILRVCVMTNSSVKALEPCNDFLDAAEMFGVFDDIKSLLENGHGGGVEIETNRHKPVDVLYVATKKGREPVALRDEDGRIFYMPPTLGVQNPERLEILKEQLFDIRQRVANAAPAVAMPA